MLPCTSAPRALVTVLFLFLFLFPLFNTLSSALPQTASPPDSLQHAAANPTASPVVPPPPVITPGPSGDEEALADQGFVQTTYYECNTMRGGGEHCGLHVPLLRAEGPKPPLEVKWTVVAVIAVTGFFVMGLL